MGWNDWSKQSSGWNDSGGSWKEKSSWSAPAEPEPAGINFGVRGDSLLNTRHENCKSTKRYRTFQESFEASFTKAVGPCTIDYKLNSGQPIRDVTASILSGPNFDILCVGVTVTDLFTSDFKVHMTYPEERLDDDLRTFAEAIKSKSSGHLVLVGGPAEVWSYPIRWDPYMERASATLRAAGIQVVPVSESGPVMVQMEIGTDYTHFANTDHNKDLFSNAWAQWILAAAADTSFGRTDESYELRQPCRDQSSLYGSARPIDQKYDESGMVQPDVRVAMPSRGRSRSPRSGWERQPPQQGYQQQQQQQQQQQPPPRQQPPRQPEPMAGGSAEADVGSIDDLMRMSFGQETAGAGAAPALWTEQQLVEWMQPVIVEALSNLPQSHQFPHVLSKMNEVKGFIPPELFQKTINAYQTAIEAKGARFT